MKTARRKFTAEFKDEAVRLALSGEKSISETARDETQVSAIRRCTTGFQRIGSATAMLFLLR